MTKSNLGLKAVIWLTLSGNSASQWEVSTGTQAKQKPGSRSWCRGHGGVLLIALLPVACSAFITQLRTTWPGMAPRPLPPCFKVGWLTLVQSSIINQESPRIRNTEADSSLSLRPVWSTKWFLETPRYKEKPCLETERQTDRQTQRHRETYRPATGNLNGGTFSVGVPLPS